MESTPAPAKYQFRYVNIRSGCSPSHICGNFVRSDTYVATCKNSVKTSKIILYNLVELETVGLQSDQITQKFIEWNAQEKECTHINYLKIGKAWYLILGFVGHFEVFNEDGSKKYFTTTSSDFDSHESPWMNAAFLSSCTISS